MFAQRLLIHIFSRVRPISVSCTDCPFTLLQPKQRRGGNDDNKAEEGEKGKHCLSLNDEPGTGLLVGIVAIAETMFGLHTHERLPHSVFPPARAISLRSEGILEEDCRWRFLEAENGKPPKERRELREERKIWNTWDGKEREHFLNGESCHSSPFKRRRM